MKFYNHQHKYYCGIDLHARSLYVCILDSTGKQVKHRNIMARPEDLMKAIEKFNDDLVIAVECMFTWYWVADFCEEHHIKFVLGHALYMKAIHGGKAKNDKIDSHKIATLLRGGMLPMAYVYPKKNRATRDLLRRRTHLMRKRAELMAHIVNLNSQYNLPEMALDLRQQKNRDSLKNHYSELSVQKSVDLDLSLIAFYDDHLSSIEWYIEKTTKITDYQNYMLLRSIPGVGLILALIILYEINDISRFKRVQDFASYARLVKCTKESGGKKLGTSGSKIGNAHLKWAFSEAAILFLRGNPEAQEYVEKLANKHGKAKALSILAHKLGRVVYIILKRRIAFDANKFVTI